MCDAIGEGGPLDELHHERGRTVSAFESVDRGDVRMIQRGHCLRLTVKPRNPIRVTREGVGHDLDRDVAIELRVLDAIDLPL